MRNKRDIMRLVAYLAAGVACIGLALLYLNSAAYSLWMSSGPPTADPDAFLARSKRHLIYSVALFVLAGIQFCLFGKVRKTRKPAS